MSFYRVPERIFNPLKDRDIVKGRVLVINDQDRTLASQIESSETVVHSCSLEDLVDDQYWGHLGEIDWVVCITQGLGQRSQWAIDAGHQIAKEGFCLLDRISFLEPTRKRESLLLSETLRNLIVLSPRPAFRADNKQLKDSVTSAWFVFSNDPDFKNDTKIEFDIDWQRIRVSRGGK